MRAFPMHTKSAASVQEHLLSICRSSCCPLIIQSDNGKEFVNQIMARLCVEFGIVHLRGRPRHPQTQGQVERANQTLVRSLQARIGDSPRQCWVDILAEVVYDYNCTTHRAINRSPMSIVSELWVERRQILDNPEVIPGYEDASSTSSVALYTLERIASPERISEVEGSANSAVSMTTGVTGPASSIAGDTVDLAILELIAREEGMPPESVVEVYPPASSGAAPEDEGVSQEYRAKYLTDMCNHADVHYRNKEFVIGQKVLIAMEFDNNPATRRAKFECWYEKGIWTVVERRGNSYIVEFEGQRRTIDKGLLKKYHE